MLITQENAENKLFNLVEKLKTQAPTYRCAVFRLSLIPRCPNDAFDIITHLFLKMIDDKAQHAFVCDDGDIFILSRHFTLKVFQKLLSHPTLVDWLVSPKGEPAHLFEVGVDGDIIQILLQPKIDVKEHREEEAAQKQKEIEAILAENKRVRALNPDICMNAVASIDDRRMKHTKPHILIVEDDPFTQKLVRKALGTFYEVSTASTASQAIQSYVRHAPDVLFLDIGLPDVDGLQVLKRIQELDDNAYIVMLSGNAQKENVVKAVNEGARGFVAKPFPKNKLEAYIQKCPFIGDKLQEVS
ncbi:MAG: response regulator [Pseudomonadota bacterium]